MDGGQRHEELRRLGWSEWHEARTECGPEDALARVAAVDREALLVMDPTGTFRATLAGRFLHRHTESHELPCVGDWVVLQKGAPGDWGLVHRVVERRTSLWRKSAGASMQRQMIAANVDRAVVVQSCHYDFNLRRLERYLVMVREGGAEPCVLLTKTDLVAPEVVDAQRAEIRAAGIEAPVLTLSNVTQEGLDELRRMLVPGQTHCFVGGSGVGKSTLINQLIGRAPPDGRRERHGRGPAYDGPARAGRARRRRARDRQSRHARVWPRGGQWRNRRRIWQHRGACDGLPVSGLQPHRRTGVRGARGGGVGRAQPGPVRELSEAAGRVGVC